MRPLSISGFALPACSFLLLAAGCGGSEKGGSVDDSLVSSKLERDIAPSVSPTDSASLSSGNTKFAFSLYQALAAGGDTDNLFYSPYSISIALAMTYAGAGEPTATEMATALDFDLPPATLHSAFDALDLALASRAKGQAGAGGKGFQLNISDSLWSDASFAFEKPFLDTLAVDYGAGVHVVDFLGAADAARNKINGWVSNETANRIQNLLPEGSVGPDTRLVLVNAIYFNAGWATAFDPQATRPGSFHHLDGSMTNASMMSASVEGATYAQGPNYQAVELPYAGGQTSMVLVVPDDGAFTAVEGALAGDFVGALFSSLTSETVDVTLPKFTVKGATFSLKTELAKLGMADAFTPAANFSAMTQESVHIDDVLHQAFVQVDETGTEAAAATAVPVTRDSVVVQPQIVTIDRPFFYFIRDIPTNTVLFVGREVDPG